MGTLSLTLGCYMLGSLRCSKCSDYWLLLISVFLIIGILLVLVLFVTVVEGKINGFIIYANVLMLVSGLDTSIPLFGVKFLILFVTCLLIFLLIQVPTNVLLIFTKFCYHSKLVASILSEAISRCLLCPPKRWLPLLSGT